ncbi:MAG: RtcB family protein [Candidatus Edwardsbacteria bacterium]
MPEEIVRKEEWKGPLEKVDDYRWLIPQTYQPGMRVPGLIYADEELIRQIRIDQTPKQVANVAHLPGIVKYSYAMPDIHWGYGLPIGGVAGIDVKTGIISPGGVGSDINCGVRLLRTNLTYEDVKDKMKELVNALFADIPSGIGSKGSIRLSPGQEEEALKKGAAWSVENGYGWKEDLDFTEARGALPGANPSKLTSRSFERGKAQLGTLGAGNHFLEIQIVREIYDEESAKVFDLKKNQIVVMIHSGSRGLGYQTCEDYVEIMLKSMGKYGISLPDRQLACAPLDSPEGKDYLAAMACAANYAWANRQCIMHWVRESFAKIFGTSPQNLGMKLIYDVAHNIAKFEEHEVDGKKMKLCIHRKGATRAFPPGHSELPEVYKKIGQPVIIPGDMGRSSYLLVGTKQAMEETFGSTCHGAGRVMSRTQALRVTKGRAIWRELGDKGIIVKSHGPETLREEVSEAYKDVDHVVNVVHQAGISKRVAKMHPLGVVKG